jgi:hypothetical protein
MKTNVWKTLDECLKRAIEELDKAPLDERCPEYQYARGKLIDLRFELWAGLTDLRIG